MKWTSSLIFIFIFFSIHGTGFTQDVGNVTRTDITQNINGKDYYLHKVKKGETLSAISRAYDVKVETLLQNNNGITENIRPDEIIKIPMLKNETLTESNLGGNVNYRRVAKGETIYSLSKEYNISIDEIKAANNGLPEGLKTGEFIKIPETRKNAEISGDKTPQEQQAKDYFEFQAKEKTNLYALAIKYRISINQLYASNPGVSENINTGEIIKIPLSTTPTNYIAHTVQSRKTMNRIARKYDIDIEEIKNINPYISRHLLVGQVLRIPLPYIKLDNENTDSLVDAHDRELTEEIREKSQKEICHSSYDNGSYDVGLILPFFISVYDSVKTIQKKTSKLTADPSFIKPFVFIQFYEGFLMAIDSMKNLGMNVTLHVYNLEDNIDEAKKLVKNPELKSMDLIVGPVYSSTFKILSDFARQYQINIVNPFSTREETTRGNPYVFQPQPVFSNQNDKLVEYLNEKHDYSQIFIARHNQYRDEVAINSLKNKLNADLETRKGPSTGLYHEIIYSQDSTYSFEHLASVEYPNVVVIYSDSKVFILDIMRSLNELRDTFNIMVIGMPDWTKIDGLEAEYLNNLNTHVITDQNKNYNLELVRSFVTEYRKQYATEPKDFAFSGYNIGIYFLSALMKYGPAFNDCIPYFDMELINMGYDFVSSGNNGFQNKNWKILGMEDYKYKDFSKRLETYDLSKPPTKFYKYMEE